MKQKFLLTVAAMMVLCGLYAKPFNKLPYLSPVEDRFTFAVPMKKAPVIDGKLEKEAWGVVPRAKYFQIKKLLTSSITKQTSFQIGYDDKYLYLAATMWESEPSTIKEGANVQDGWPVTDRINFIFSHKYNRKGTWQDSPYIFLMFGAGGIHRGFYNELPGKVEKPLIDETREWITAYRKDETRWYIESRIPLKLLGLNAKSDKIFLNVRRDVLNGPKAEAENTWNPITDPRQDAHCFGTLYFLKGNPRVGGLEDRINGRSKYAAQTSRLKVLAYKKGEYIGAKQMYGSQPGWQEAEKLVDEFRRVYDAEFKKNPWTISDQFEDYYMKWKHIIHKLEKSSPTTPFTVKTKNAKVLSVKLNGLTLKAKNGVYDFSLIAGINALEITAEATGANPGVRFNLKSSPDTSTTFSAAAPGADVKTAKKADVKNGYIWSGNQKKVVFRQNLIWNRTYGRHSLEFIGPHVKEWGVSPKETMFFMHAIYNPKKSGKCTYRLIIEAPEGFTRVNDHWNAINYFHRPTKDIKTEKITHKGKKYVRYTYTWKLPEKLHRRYLAYMHHISFKHDGYKFAKGEKVDFRFRRVIDDDTSDVVNVIKVAELPPINGRKLKHIVFPQYHQFMGGYVSREQYTGMAENAVKSGLAFFILGGPNAWELRDPNLLERREFKKKLYKKYGTANFTWPRFNAPLWGAGKGTFLTDLVVNTPDLRATYYNNTGAYAPDWHNEFCFTKALGKYRKQFKAALKKEYDYSIKNGISSVFFFNDENYPHGDKGNWQHAYCFCKDCKVGFRAMFKIPASVKLDDETIVHQYAAQWAKWWKRKQKNELLRLSQQTLAELGGKMLYYHNTHDTDAFAESKGIYDIVSIPIPGQNYVGSHNQERMDSQKREGEKITGAHQSVGQFHSYFPSPQRGGFTIYSSDSFYFYPREQKMAFVRLAAITHKGAFIECASFYSAGGHYYVGEATRMIATFEHLFHDGVRADKLAKSDKFKYPNLLVLKKGDERLVLIFNEGYDKPVTGTLQNLKLKPGQKAVVWESGKPYGKADTMRITVQPQDVIAVHIK